MFDIEKHIHVPEIKSPVSEYIHSLTTNGKGECESVKHVTFSDVMKSLNK